MSFAESWDTAVPANASAIKDGASVIRSAKTAIAERVDVEHTFTDGEHKAGSACAYLSDEGPSLTKTQQAGRICIASSQETYGRDIRVHTGTAWATAYDAILIEDALDGKVTLDDDVHTEGGAHVAGGITTKVYESVATEAALPVVVAATHPEGFVVRTEDTGRLWVSDGSAKWYLVDPDPINTVKMFVGTAWDDTSEVVGTKGLGGTYPGWVIYSTLSGKFPRGIGEATTPTSGGADTFSLALAKANLPVHAHTVSAQTIDTEASTVNVKIRNATLAGDGTIANSSRDDSTEQTWADLDSTSHVHEVTVPEQDTETTGSGTAVLIDTVPAYSTVLFIKKIAPGYKLPA